LKNWKECPWRHKLIYIDEEPYFSANQYTAFGTAIHTALESFKEKEPSQLYDIFCKNFLNAIKSIEEEDKINKEQISEFLLQAKPICDQALSSIESYFGKFEIVSIEEELLERIPEFDAHGRNFKGYIDLVIKTEDKKYHIIDWKTCSWGWPSNKKSDPLVNYQLSYYKNYFSKKHNIEKDNIETYFVLLKRTPKKDNVEVVRITSGDKKIKNSLKLLENAVINIEKKFYPKNRLSCKYCKFHKTEKCI